MDSLSTLPLAQTKQTDEEIEVMDRFFGDERRGFHGEQPPLTSRVNWKTLLAAVGVCAISNLPWWERLTDRLPYGDSILVQVMSRAIIFALLLFAYMLYSNGGK